ncbi:hypothetical protein Hanom_Chr11g00975741 [Helianthus anomalus]
MSAPRQHLRRMPLQGWTKGIGGWAYIYVYILVVCICVCEKGEERLQRQQQDEEDADAAREMGGWGGAAPRRPGDAPIPRSLTD